MPYTRLFLACTVMFAMTLACGRTAPPAAPATEAPTLGPDTTGTAHAESVAAAVTTTLEAQAKLADQDATAAAETRAAAEATGVVLATQTAAAARSTRIVENRQATGTASAATSVARATANAQPLAEVVQRLVTDGYLSQGNGHFEKLPEFHSAWAQINWYQWLPTGSAPTDFVVRAEVAWDSASNKANWFSSGCGFVFREAANAANDHYLIFLALDGVVYLSRQHFDDYFDLGSAGYGRLEVPKGQARIMLAVEGDRIHFFVNDEHVLTRVDGHLDSGALNYTLLSGTNKDFGTRCDMTDVGLWWLEP